MATDLYERLAKHLDGLPAGFPRTESGVELRILRRVFTPEDAELALHLTLIPEGARVIARRAKIPVKEAPVQPTPSPWYESRRPNSLTCQRTSSRPPSR